jgi:hypothetical protein
LKHHLNTASFFSFKSIPVLSDVMLNRAINPKEVDMEVVAILLSLTGLGVAVTLALKEERRAQTQLAECLANTKCAHLRRGPDR